MSAVDLQQATVLVVAEHHEAPDFLGELARDERLRPLGRVMSTADAVEVVREHRPDVVVAEVLTRGRVEELAEVFRAAPSVVLSTLPPDIALLSAMAGGARGYVWRPVEEGVLHQAVVVVAAGLVYVDPRSTEWLVELGLYHHMATVEHGLTLRQSQVLHLVRVGLTNKEIAAALGITAETVKTHLHEAMRRLGVHSRLEAALAAETTRRVPTIELPSDGDAT